MAQCTEVNCRPGICATVQLMGLASETIANVHYDFSNKTIAHMKWSCSKRLAFEKIDMISVRVAVISDVSFASASIVRRQRNFDFLMADKYRHAKIVHYASNSYHRVSRSVMAAEVDELVYAVDVEIIVKKH